MWCDPSQGGNPPASDIELSIIFAVRAWRFCARLCRCRPQYQHRDELLDELSYQPEGLEHRNPDYGRHAIRASAGPSKGSGSLLDHHTLTVSKLLPPYTHVEIPGAAEGSDRVARGCSHHREERHLARLRAIGGDVPQRF